ncbi:unnamed protein product [Rhizophagus irregularis]|uniref:Uncharacterized protein n=1 Tax=Rhizophagus irregularis TaxID=588596 RepID=A0A916E3R8_9GLOM|nr:unnamed protein product [Rhizophagus irregularis]CAB5357320.1 unnamed protein product [Rhizophagus irregularis]
MINNTDFNVVPFCKLGKILDRICLTFRNSKEYSISEKQSSDPEIRDSSSVYVEITSFKKSKFKCLQYLI